LARDVEVGPPPLRDRGVRRQRGDEGRRQRPHPGAHRGRVRTAGALLRPRGRGEGDPRRRGGDSSGGVVRPLRAGRDAEVRVDGVADDAARDRRVPGEGVRGRPLGAVARIAAVLAIALPAPTHLVVKVSGSSTSLLSTTCFIKIRQHVVGGGTTTYCLETFHGRPGPNATVRDSGVMTFALKGRTIRANVQIVEKLA